MVDSKHPLTPAPRPDSRFKRRIQAPLSLFLLLFQGFDRCRLLAGVPLHHFLMPGRTTIVAGRSLRGSGLAPLVGTGGSICFSLLLVLDLPAPRRHASKARDGDLLVLGFATHQTSVMISQSI